MFCAIKIQPGLSDVRYVKSEDIIVFGRKNTYSVFEPTNPLDFKPKGEYGLIEGNKILRCIILALGDNEEELKKRPLKPFKVSSKRKAEEDLSDWTLNIKKSKEDRKVKGAQAIDDIISKKLQQTQNNLLMQVGLDTVTAEVSVHKRKEHVNSGDVNEVESSLRPERNITENPNVDLIESDSENHFENVPEAFGKTTTSPLVSIPSPAPSEDGFESNFAESSKNDNCTDTHSAKSVQLEDKEIHDTESESEVPQNNPLKDREIGTNEVISTICNNDEQEEPDFTFSGDDVKDSQSLMLMFKSMFTRLKSIDSRISRIEETLNIISSKLSNKSQPSQLPSASVIASNNCMDDDESLPGFVHFGGNLHVATKTVKAYAEERCLLQTKINNICLAVFQENLVNYCLRPPKDPNCKREKLPQTFISKLTDVINDANREIAFTDFLKQHKTELNSLKSANEISKRMAEYRELSSAQCQNLKETEIRAKLTHTLYNARQLIKDMANKKLQAQGQKQSDESNQTK